MGVRSYLFSAEQKQSLGQQHLCLQCVVSGHAGVRCEQRRRLLVVKTTFLHRSNLRTRVIITKIREGKIKLKNNGQCLRKHI